MKLIHKFTEEELKCLIDLVKEDIKERKVLETYIENCNKERLTTLERLLAKLDC